MAEVDWSVLAGKICGKLVLRSDSNFGTEVEGLVWNGLKPQRFPGAIAQCLNEGDVRECILFARASGLKLVVRGGGHNWNGAQVRDGVLVIDVSRLNDVHVDPVHQRAIIQPVVTNDQLVAALEKEGLAYQVGDCPSVPASGYLLVGGLGLNTPNWGAGCQGVDAIHVVDAWGNTFVADETHNADLYWAARGGAQGFPGVIVRYRLRARPYPQAIHQATCVYRLEDSQRFADWLSEFILDAPPALHSNTLITSTLSAKLAEDLGHHMPPLLRKALEIVFGDENKGAHRDAWLTYLGVAFADTEEEAHSLLAPFKKPPPGPKPVFWASNTPSSFWILNAFVGTLFPYGRQYVADYHWVDVSLGEVVKRVSAEFRKTREADSFVLVASYQTPPAQMMPPGSACFSMSSHNLVGIYGIGDEPSDLPYNRKWVGDMRALLEPNSLGLYVGEADLEAFPGRAAQCYSPEAWARLREIKRRYDPENLFAWFLGDESPSAP